MISTRWYVRHYAWIGLTALWVIGFIGAISRFIMASYQVQMAKDMDAGRGFISAAWSTNLFIAAICAPVGGRLVDRYGAKRVLIIGSLFGIAGTGLVCLGRDPIIFFVGYGILSGLTGLGASASYVLLFQWFGRHQAKAAGILSSASSVGLAVCTPVFLSNSSLTWEYAFMLSAVLGLAVTLPLIVFLVRPAEPSGAGEEIGGSGHAAIEVAALEAPAVPASHAVPIAVPKPAHRGAAFLPLGIVAFALFTCGINMGTVEMNLVAIYQESHVTPEMIALSIGMLGVMEIVGSLAFGILMDALDKRLAMALLYGIRLAGFVILLLHVSWTPVAFAFAFGVTYLGAVPGGMLIAGELTNNKGRLVGNLLLFHQGGGILGALVGGIAYDVFHNYQLLIGIDAVLCVIAAAGYITLRRRHYPIPKGEVYHAA